MFPSSRATLWAIRTCRALLPVGPGALPLQCGPKSHALLPRKRLVGVLRADKQVRLGRGGIRAGGCRFNFGHWLRRARQRQRSGSFELGGFVDGRRLRALRLRGRQSRRHSLLHHALRVLHRHDRRRGVHRLRRGRCRLRHGSCGGLESEERRRRSGGCRCLVAQAQRVVRAHSGHPYPHAQQSQTRSGHFLKTKQFVCVKIGD